MAIPHICVFDTVFAHHQSKASLEVRAMLVRVVSENDVRNAACTYLSAAIEPKSEEPWEEGSIRTAEEVQAVSGRHTRHNSFISNTNFIASHIYFDRLHHLCAHTQCIVSVC